MNRYVNLSPSRFDPLSWEEVSRVPMAKRLQHNANDKALTELGTNIGAIDNLGVHDKQTQALQQEYRDKLDALSNSLATEGVNGFNTQDVLKMNSQYKKDWSPGGRAYQINQAKKSLDTTKKEFFKAAISQGNDMNVANRLWNKHVADYGQGIDENGKIKNIDSLFMGKFIDVNKDLDSTLSQAVLNATKNLKPGTFVVKQYPQTGGYYVEQTIGSTTTKTNLPALDAAVIELKDSYSQGPRAQFVKDYGLDVNDMINKAKGKYIVDSTETTTKTKRQNIGSAPKPTKTKNTDFNSDFGVNNNTRTTYNPETIESKKNELRARIANPSMDSGQLSQDKADLRDLENLTYDAKKSLENNPEYVNVKIENENLKKSTLKQIDSLLQNKDTAERTKAFLKLNKELIENNQEVYLNPEYGNDNTTEMLLNLSSSNNKLKSIKEPLIKNYLKTKGIEHYDIRAFSSNKDDKEFNTQMLKFVNNNSSLSPTFDGKGTFDKFFPDTMWGTVGESEKNALRKDVYKVLTSGQSKHVKGNFNVNGNNVTFRIDGVLPQGYEFKAPTGRKNKTIGKGGEQVSMSIPLIVEGSNGVRELAPGAIQLIYSSVLNNDSKSKLIRMVVTSMIKSTNDIDKIGNNTFSANLLKSRDGVSISNSNKGLDLLKTNIPDVNKVYEVNINEDNTISKNPIKVNSLTKKFGDEEKLFNYLNDNNMIYQYKKMARSKSLNDVLDDIKSGELNVNDDFKKTIINAKNIGKTNLGQILGLNNQTHDMNNFQKRAFQAYIMGNDLLIGKPSDLTL